MLRLKIEGIDVYEDMSGYLNKARRPIVGASSQAEGVRRFQRETGPEVRNGRISRRSGRANAVRNGDGES